jgi:hypothetical protein
VAVMRKIYLYPEASQVLAAFLPELEQHILAPHQLLAVAFRLDDLEEAGIGLWVPAPTREEQPKPARVLLPWRFVATMIEYEDPTVEAGRTHGPIGFERAERVG